MAGDVTFYELPGLDEMVLEADAQDETVWMQCRICLETWEVVTVRDALDRYNEHTCKEKTSGSGA
jgi:hypothetical protein